MLMFDYLLDFFRFSGDGDSVCVCGSSLGPSVEPDTLTLSLSPSSLIIQQPGSFYTASNFQDLIQSVFFETGPPSPESSYQAVVMVTVNDGELVNQPPAFATVQVNIMNEAPRVLLDDEQVFEKFV